MIEDKMNSNIQAQSRKVHEGKDQAKTRIKSDLIENAIVNQFLEDEVGIIFEPKDVVNSRYMNSKREDQKVFNQLAFQIVSDSYEKEINDHPGMSAVEFPNYVKLFNKSRDWGDELRHVDSQKGTPAYFFFDTFNEDMGLFRTAALEGYKNNIITSQQSKVKST